MSDRFDPVYFPIIPGKKKRSVLLQSYFYSRACLYLSESKYLYVHEYWYTKYIFHNYEKSKIWLMLEEVVIVHYCHSSQWTHNYFTGFLKNTFLLWNTCSMTNECEHSTESSFICFIQPPLVLASYINMAPVSKLRT